MPLASRTGYKKMFEKLDGDYRGLLAEHREMKREIKALRKENEDLRRQLAYHDNPNTPPSRRIAKRRKETATPREDPAGKEKSTRRRGAQPGHQGKTSKPAPTKFETHAPFRCPGCGGTSLEVENIEERDITEIPKPVPATTTRHYTVICSCGECGLDGIGAGTGPAGDAAVPVPDIPKRGSYGKNVMMTVVHNFLDRLPHKRNADSMGRHGITMSTGTIHNVVSGTGYCLEKPASEIRARIRRARRLHVDETSISLNGRKVWIWVFLDPDTGDAYYIIRSSRGRKVVHEVLGKGWSGTIICDGWTAYKGYRIQRCWSHILREAGHIADLNEHCRQAREVADALYRIYWDGMGAEGPPTVRRALRDSLRKRVSRIINRYADHPVLEKFMTTLSNALPSLFRFVIDPAIPATNNAAERALRELVVHRKVRGSIRSVKTMDWLANLFTCVTTWKARGIDYAAQVARYI